MSARLRMGEAAQRLGLSQDTVREWVRRGFIKAHRTPTGQLFFDEADVESARQGDRPRPPAASTGEPALIDLPGESKEASPWKKLPPWVTKVETARASLTVDELEAERKERAMARETERQRAIAAEHRTARDGWVFPSPDDAAQAVSRHRVRFWWKRLETLAGLPPEGGRGWHTFRRKFATELKHVPLADLAYLGGWQSAQTILKCYQQPDDVTLRSALTNRGTLTEGGLETGERTPRMDTTEPSGTKEKNPASA